MAEAIALIGSVIAVVQLADRVAKACKFFIDTAQDYPKDLRLIYVEIGSLKLIYEGLKMLDPNDPSESATLTALQEPVRRSWAVLARSLNADALKKLLGEIMQYKSTISLALQRQLLGLYESGTRDWVISTPEWDDWINFRQRAIWLHGIPGAGKTVLAPYVFDRICGICMKNDKETADESIPFLRWLVGRLPFYLKP
ncbi:hypothetical protein B0H63DRAFT_493317 [Podospora didyma]|uniref:Nephrocystin 3-like N-terminal domain-containing protein n=1 Tax=Podospora didyma TaxID=330526 RepID=A0AAE0NRT7_9PEZI|nr:hypothetical protein B0H63DRAFT_493317 [Podospora didyma]